MFTAQWEAESIKKSYSKVVDAYGCLGILKINLGKKNHYYYSLFIYQMSCVHRYVRNLYAVMRFILNYE